MTLHGAMTPLNGSTLRWNVSAVLVKLTIPIARKYMKPSRMK